MNIQIDFNWACYEKKHSQIKILKLKFHQRVSVALKMAEKKD